jgi:hypothetical protein
LNKDIIPSLDMGRACIGNRERTSVIVACIVEKVVERFGWDFARVSGKAAEIEVKDDGIKTGFFARMSERRRIRRFLGTLPSFLKTYPGISAACEHSHLCLCESPFGRAPC